MKKKEMMKTLIWIKELYKYYFIDAVLLCTSNVVKLHLVYFSGVPMRMI